MLCPSTMGSALARAERHGRSHRPTKIIGAARGGRGSVATGQGLRSPNAAQHLGHGTRPVRVRHQKRAHPLSDQTKRARIRNHQATSAANRHVRIGERRSAATTSAGQNTATRSRVFTTRKESRPIYWPEGQTRRWHTRRLKSRSCRACLVSKHSSSEVRRPTRVRKRRRASSWRSRQSRRRCGSANP